MPEVLLVIKTDDYGYVACIPLGMSEVSSVVFDPDMSTTSKTTKVAVTKGKEMGKFEYGGSSFVMIFQKLPGKKLMFQSAAGDVYEKRPVLPKGSASVGGNITLIGSQIGKWEDVSFNVDSKSPWQNTGYVNMGKSYKISYVGGLWTANPNVNNGNLYGPKGSDIIATQQGYAMPGKNEGALVGRIGTNDPFLDW